MSVTQLTNVVRLRMEEHFASTWVEGEVSNFVRASSGHTYFTLKDAGAQLKCAMFRGFALRLKFEPRDGLSAIARGGLSVFVQRGEYQMIVEELHPKGIGAAELALRQLKEKLLGKGYFDPRRKRPLPRYPRRVALIASATGAAIRDMIELLAQRWPVAQVVVRPSRVQGEGAAEDIAANVRFLSQLHSRRLLPLDAVVIGRGGGSAEDLWAFNEECVADAIFESSIPVISAVGHEIDVTVADLVADHRAETPSAAIVLLTPDGRKLAGDLAQQSERLHAAASQRIRLARQRVDQLAQRPALRKPLDRIRECEQEVDRLAERLHRAAKQKWQRSQVQVDALSEQLEGLSPLKVLKRGYSLTRRGDGTLVRTPEEVAVGEILVTRVHNGEIRSRVIGTTASSEDLR
jgi:exodeoxyribonuclease VII large subunit